MLPSADPNVITCEAVFGSTRDEIIRDVKKLAAATRQYAISKLVAAGGAGGGFTANDFA